MSLKHMLSGEAPTLSSKEEMNETEEEAPNELAKDVVADNATHHNLKEFFNKVGLEVIDVTKEEAPAELLKEAIADDDTGQGLEEKNKIKDETPDELLKGVTADDASGPDLFLVGQGSWPRGR